MGCLNRYIRERFLIEIEHHGIDSFAELNDRFDAWAERVANTRVHAETNERPIDRFHAGGPPRFAEPDKLSEAFRWSVTRKVTRTATISIEGNHYGVDAALVGQRVEVRFDPEDLTRLDVFHNGRPAGAATPFVIGTHTHRAVPQATRPEIETTGIDYLGMVQTAHEADTVGTIAYRDIPLAGGTGTQGGDQR